MKDVSLILLAGGTSSRFQDEVPKQFHLLKNKMVAHYSLDTFLKSPHIAEIVVVTDPLFEKYFENYRVVFAPAGKLRQISCENGLKKVSFPWVCIHDAARPLISLVKIHDLIQEGKKYGAASLGLPVTSTIKEVEEGLVRKTLKREILWDIQTPQFSSKDLLNKGLKKIKKNNITITDDVSLIELQGLPVKIVKGDHFNIKLTYKEDMGLLSHYLEYATL